MSSSAFPLPRLGVAVLAAGLLLLLAGCGPSEQAMIGVWRGHSNDTAYTFELRPDGQGRVHVVTGRNRIDYACAWSVSGERLWLRHERGPSASFRIVEQADDEILVRVANGFGGLCRMQRVVAR